MAQEAGRAIMASVAIAGKLPITIVSFYGWVNGQGEDKRFRTTALMEAIAGELSQWPAGPQFVLGDLNAQASSLHSTAWLCEAGVWHGVGHVANLWCSPVDVTTVLGGITASSHAGSIIASLTMLAPLQYRPLRWWMMDWLVCTPH